MIASVYIKDGNIHFYNEGDSLSAIGGLAYELGKPLLNFICFEPERFDEGFSDIAAAFEMPGGEIGMHAPEIQAGLRGMLTDMQASEIYLYFYGRALINAAYAGKPVREALNALSDDFRSTLAFAQHEIEYLLMLREKFPGVQPMEYLYMLDLASQRDFGASFFLEEPFKVFYGVPKPPEVVELYEIEEVRDLLRFEFIKMVEHNIFIKRCKNCGWFFIPSRRADAEYCDRMFADTGRKCSEIGAMRRYERKVAEDPVWEAYKKAYRRFNSRTRARKMTQAEFLQWSEQAARKRDECLAGDLPLEEYREWLEQGRIRKQRTKKQDIQ
jgi:hypothetical protein